MRHHQSKLCTTNVEHFGVKVGELTIFEDVNFTIHCGELTALIGPNGAGKSTLLKSILGEVAHSGTLNYFDAKGKHLRPIIGYVPQTLKFDATSPTTVLDLFMACLTARPVWLCSSKFIRGRVTENLRRVKAEHLIDRRLGALSGGELQRILLALALDPLPDLLLLDEPISGVDKIGMRIFYELVAELKAAEDMAILLISHDLDMLERFADRVILLNKRVLKFGTVREVFDSPEMREVFQQKNFPAARE
ncbi:MAG: metal ABC transporter ATP-binding protein [Selenomonadaceae bacterium]|nr:metal ABC transporter ATP-binding protein [Selenomonadaceae bacterium]